MIGESLRSAPFGILADIGLPVLSLAGDRGKIRPIAGVDFPYFCESGNYPDRETSAVVRQRCRVVNSGEPDMKLTKIRFFATVVAGKVVRLFSFLCGRKKNRDNFPKI